MTSYQQRVSLLEFLYKEPCVSFADVPETLETLESLIQDVFDDFQHSMVLLREQVSAQWQNPPR